MLTKISITVAAILASSLVALPAQADSAITVGTTNFGAGVATNLGISLTGFDETQSYQATVKFVDNETSEDVTNGVLAATPGATSLVAGYSSYSSAKLGFSGTYAAVAQALSSVTWNPANASGNISVRIGMASQAGENGFYDANSQHYYRYISTPTSWTDARTFAESQELFGLQGYLAEIGSAAENAFIGTETSARNIWIGAREDEATAANPGATPYTGAPGSRWTWQGAIETPLPTSTGASALGIGAAFSSWAAGEPNNDTSNGYDCAVTNWGDGIGFWNDLPCSSAQSFLVEFGGREVEASTASTRTITATVVAKAAANLGNFRSDLTCSLGVDCSFPLSLANPTAKNSENEDLEGDFTYTSSNPASTTVVDGIGGASVSVVRPGLSTITVTFTPGDTELYASNTKSFTITVIAGNPATATALRANAGNTEVALSWTPGPDGGSDITDYAVEYSADNAIWSTFADGVSAASMATVTGLTNGTLYYFRVTPISVIGNGPASTSVSSTPTAPAPAPAAPPASPEPVASPPPVPTPLPSRSPSPINTPRPAGASTPSPVVSSPPIVESGSLTNPAVLVERLIEALSEFLRPITVDVFAAPKPNAPKLADQTALNFVTAADKKISNMPSLLLFDEQYQPTKLVIVEKTIAQVVGPTGGVISVQAKNGNTPVAVSSSGRVQMVKSNSVVAQGNGLAPNTEFAVYLFSTPTLLGVGKTNNKGEFFVTFPVKKSIPLGDHTLQVNGLLTDGRVSSVSMPVTVVDFLDAAGAIDPPEEVSNQESTATEAAVEPNLVCALLLILLLITLLVAWRIWIAARKRKREQRV